MPLAVASGAYIFLAVVILIVIGVALAYSRRGSGIAEHPIDDRAAAPGASGPTEFESSDEELPGNAGTR
jgi:hypothetical protein